MEIVTKRKLEWAKDDVFNATSIHIREYIATIEQFAEALRNQWHMCACSDGCAACKKTHALLAQYDGETTEGGK